ncbi:MAG TPA: lamin tail domain-containing protein, partial [Rhodothermales bacterium]|nr:lamin tail domain-containing protein [Rhodothermales bacterium]
MSIATPRGATPFLFALLVMLLGFAPATHGQATDLFFSEYIEGSSLNKALEIYNGTSAAVDLAAEGYQIEMYFNGNTSASTTVALTGVVAVGDVYVVADDGADAAILAQTDQTSTSSFFNGNDAIVLRKGGSGGAIVDVIGQVGNDPGSEWSGGGIGTQNETLRRMETTCAGDTDPDDAFDPSVEWVGFAQDTFDGLGVHTADCGGSSTPPMLVISEIMYNPASAEDNWEWIEVYNSGTTPVDLSGFVVDDINSVAHSAANIASGTIAAGETGILYNADDVAAA